jgi:hypothetical protein
MEPAADDPVAAAFSVSLRRNATPSAATVMAAMTEPAASVSRIATPPCGLPPVRLATRAVIWKSVSPGAWA